MKKTLCVLTSALTTVCLLGLCAAADVVGGSCGKQGDNVVWSYDSATEMLTITGKGEMDDWWANNGREDRSPWYDVSVSTVVIGDGVTSIGDSAFDSCGSLTSVALPNSVAAIGDNAFYRCTSLASILLPNSVTSIGVNAFYRCTSLASIALPNSVTTIGDGAFEYCTALTGILIPSGVTAIGNEVFEQCTALTRVVIPDTVTAIGDSAFSDCKSLSVLAIPEGVTSIGNSAFLNCKALTGIALPRGVTTIGNAAFEYCTAMTSIVIPDSVTTIGDEAFSWCSALTTVTLPNSVTYIGNDAFRYTPLATLTFTGSKAELDAILADSGNIYLRDGAEIKFLNLPPAGTVTLDVENTAVSDWALAELRRAKDNDLFPEFFLGKNLTGKITRAEFASVAVRLYQVLSGKYPSAASDPFTDIDACAQKNDIRKAYALGITSGATATTFEPNAFLTREQMAVMLTRAYKKAIYPDWTPQTDVNYPLSTEGAPKFADDAAISVYARESVGFLAAHGVIGGIEGGRFAPHEDASEKDPLYGLATCEQAIAIALRVKTKLGV